jgi:Haem-degrading
MTVTLAEANTIVAAAIAKARQLNIIINVAVCDNQGHLIAFNRMDRAYAEGDRYAIGKAVASAGTGLPSGEVVSRVDHPPVAGVVAEVRRRFMFAADCRSCEVAKSREDAASMGRHPSMSKKKHALVLGLLASNRSK